MGYVDKHHCKTPQYDIIPVAEAEELMGSGQFKEFWECPAEGCYKLWKRNRSTEWVNTVRLLPAPRWENFFHWRQLGEKKRTRVEREYTFVYRGWATVKPDNRVLIEVGDGTVKEVR